jgi:L-asparaginase
VAIVASGAGADPRQVSALEAAGCAGIVVAATGNGMLHRELEAALRDATGRGLAVLRSTRCLEGRIVEVAERADDFASAGALTPAKARVELILRLLAGRGAA